VNFSTGQLDISVIAGIVSMATPYAHPKGNPHTSQMHSALFYKLLLMGLAVDYSSASWFAALPDHLIKLQVAKFRRENTVL